MKYIASGSFLRRASKLNYNARDAPKSTFDRQ